MEHVHRDAHLAPSIKVSLPSQTGLAELWEAASLSFFILLNDQELLGWWNPSFFRALLWFFQLASWGMIAFSLLAFALLWSTFGEWISPSFYLSFLQFYKFYSYSQSSSLQIEKSQALQLYLPENKVINHASSLYGAWGQAHISGAIHPS